MVRRPWLNAEGKPILALCEEGPCCGIVISCCVGGGPQVRIPPSAIQAEDCTFPVYANLTVEVSGHINNVSCNVNGSYSVPNTLDCLIGGTDNPSKCAWTARYAQICSFVTVPFGSPQPFSPHVMVWVHYGKIRASVGLMQTTSTCNSTHSSLTYFEIMAFELDTSPAIPSLVGAVDLPPKYSNSAWDGSPLTVYF